METTYKADQLRSSQDAVSGHGSSSDLYVLSTIVFWPATTITAIKPFPWQSDIFVTLVNMGEIPSNARISGLSTIWCDSLSTNFGLPILEVGMIGVNNGVSEDYPNSSKKLLRDARFDASDFNMDVANAKPLIQSETAPYGLRAWEYFSGVNEDPRGTFQIIGANQILDTDVDGYLAMELIYSLD